MQRAVWCAAVLVMLSGCGNNEVERAVRDTLLDPDAGEFRDVQRCSGDSEVWSGDVNGKNRMGAYTGFEPFFYDGVSVAYASDPRFMSLMKRCYGDLAVATDAATDAATANDVGVELPQAANGDWLTTEDVNPVDDSKTIVSSLIAESGQSSQGGLVSLIVRCASNQTEMYVVWDDYLGDDSRDVYYEFKNVTVRVGGGEATTERWGISTDKEATFAPGSPIDLLRRMSKADRLVLQTTPYNENPVTAVFELKGIGKALKPVADECDWTL